MPAGYAQICPFLTVEFAFSHAGGIRQNSHIIE
jgi:hypothetical protein